MILCLTDGTDQVVESHRTHVTHIQDFVNRRILFCPFTDGTIELDNKHRVLLDFG